MRDKPNMPKDLFNLWAFVLCAAIGSIPIYFAASLLGWLIGFDVEPYRWWIHGLGTLAASWLLQYIDWQ